MAIDVVIRSEDDAWLWLKRAMDGEIPDDEPVNLRFDGWPTLDLSFRGHDFESSVPTRIMPPLLEAQKEIHRIYAQLRYGQQNLRKLTSEEREDLELVVKVEKGSSLYQTNLDEALNNAVSAAVDKMDSVHLLILGISAAVIWGSNVAWKAWLKKKETEKELETRVQMSALERDKLQVMADAVRRVPVIADLSEGADQFRNNSLAKLKPNDSLTVPDSDIAVDGERAAEMTHKDREESAETRLDGQYTILSVVSGATRGFRVKVQSAVDDRVFTVTIPDDSLTRAQVEILKNNEWAKRPVHLQINAKVRRGEVTSAVLMDASDIQRE